MSLLRTNPTPLPFSVTHEIDAAFIIVTERPVGYAEWQRYRGWLVRESPEIQWEMAAPLPSCCPLIAVANVCGWLAAQLRQIRHRGLE